MALVKSVSQWREREREREDDEEEEKIFCYQTISWIQLSSLCLISFDKESESSQL